jgi:hypothetical protein
MAYKDERQAVRLFLKPEEHRRVRLAAAACELPMSEFCRKAVTEAASRVPITAATSEAPPKKPRGRPRKGK